MKKIILVAAAIFSLTLLPNLQAGDSITKDDIQGTWKLVSAKYGDETEFSDFPKEQLKLKLITDTHWLWIQRPADDRHVQTLMGGTYSLKGNTYKESVAFIGQPTEGNQWLSDAIGAKNTFTIEVDGDKLHLYGELQSGMKIDEIWKRVK